MEAVQHLMQGFALALAPVNLLFAFIGSLLGTLVGVLPGLGPGATISLLLPLTYAISSPLSAIIMLAGVFYGAMYGGSTTSILINTPGESASVVTCLDGYQMARQGRAGPALAIAAIGSFIAGMFALLMLIIIAKPLAEVALRSARRNTFPWSSSGWHLPPYRSGGSMSRAYHGGAGGLSSARASTRCDGPIRLRRPLLHHGFEVRHHRHRHVRPGRSLPQPQTGDDAVSRLRVPGILPTMHDWRDRIRPLRAAPSSASSSGCCPAADRGGVVHFLRGRETDLRTPSDSAREP